MTETIISMELPAGGHLAIRRNRIRELIRREYALNEDYMDTLAETLYEHYYES